MWASGQGQVRAHHGDFNVANSRINMQRRRFFFRPCQGGQQGFEVFRNGARLQPQPSAKQVRLQSQPSAKQVRLQSQPSAKQVRLQLKLVPNK